MLLPSKLTGFFCYWTDELAAAACCCAGVAGAGEGAASWTACGLKGSSPRQLLKTPAMHSDQLPFAKPHACPSNFISN